MRPKTRSLAVSVSVAALAVVAATAAAFASLCSMGGALTDAVGVRMTLLAGQLEPVGMPLRAASLVLLAPLFVLGYRRSPERGEADGAAGPAAARVVAWIATVLVGAALLAPWLSH